jgi:hypothetical protein
MSLLKKFKKDALKSFVDNRKKMLGDKAIKISISFGQEEPEEEKEESSAPKSDFLKKKGFNMSSFKEALKERMKEKE